MIQLQKDIYNKFPEFNAKFYSNRRNFYIHIGIENLFFDHSNFKQLLEEINSFINEHLPEKCISNNFPRLINLTKWKYNYIVCRKKNG